MVMKEKEVETLSYKDFTDKYGLIMTSISDLSDQQELVATGVWSVDYLTGGAWRGHIFVLEGKERSGKSSLLYTIIYNLITRYNFKVAFIDAEGSLDESFMSNIGLLNNPNLVMIKVAGYGESALQGIQKLVQSKQFDVVAIDSLAALVPQQLAESDAAGTFARMMSRYIGAISQAALSSNTMIFATNQIRIDLSSFHAREIPVGGNALRHFSATRISLYAKEQEKYFQYSLLRCNKSKNHVPNREIMVKIFFGKGLDLGFDAVEVGLKIGEIKELGGWLEYKGKKYRRAELEIYLAHNNPDWSLELLAKENAEPEELLPSQMLPVEKEEKEIAEQKESNDDKRKAKKEKK